MSDAPAELMFPNSVNAYLTDPATRAGVDALLAVEADSLPPEIEWDELGDYFAARAVAELTRAEFAIAMHNLWRAIWAPIIPKRWTLPKPEELDGTGQAVSTGVIWEEKAFYVYHASDGRELFTLVGLDRRRLILGFSLEQRDKPQIKDGLEDFSWRENGQWPAWMLMTKGHVPAPNGEMDLAHFKNAAQLAIAAVESMPLPMKRKSRTKAGSRAAKPRAARKHRPD